MFDRPSVFVVRSVACIILGAAAAIAPVGAQGARGEGVGPGGTFPYSSAYFSTGGTWMNVDGINGVTTKAGYYTVSNDAISYGGGLRLGFGRMLFGGEFATVDYGEEGNLNNGRTIRLKNRYYLAQVGYAWWAGRHFNLYPVIGAGLGAVTLDVSDRNGGGATPAGVDPTFDEVVQHPNYSANLVGNYLLFEPAIAADWLVLRSVADRFGLTMGARIGRRIAPNRSTWKVGGTKVVGGPDAGPDGTFLRLTVGIGWR
jgi:hypothetical protein